MQPKNWNWDQSRITENQERPATRNRKWRNQKQAEWNSVHVDAQKVG